MEIAISTRGMKSKLENLAEHMPNHDRTVHQFGGFLATRLNPKLDPPGFVLAAELALLELEVGRDFSGNEIKHPLVGYPPVFYSSFKYYLPLIAEAVAPKNFAQRVKEFIREAQEL